MSGKHEADFAAEQARAVERMREMSRRAQMPEHPHPMPPAPSFVKLVGNEAETPKAADAPKKAAPPQNPHRNEKQNRPAPPVGENDLFSDLFGKTNPTLFGRLINDRDSWLLAGLLFILWNDQADRRLMLALLYILL